MSARDRCTDTGLAKLELGPSTLSDFILKVRDVSYLFKPFEQ
jgi:hypothetical protein